MHSLLSVPQQPLDKQHKTVPGEHCEGNEWRHATRKMLEHEERRGKKGKERREVPMQDSNRQPT